MEPPLCCGCRRQSPTRKCPPFRTPHPAQSRTPPKAAPDRKRDRAQAVRPDAAARPPAPAPRLDLSHRLRTPSATPCRYPGPGTCVAHPPQRRQASGPQSPTGRSASPDPRPVGPRRFRTPPQAARCPAKASPGWTRPASGSPRVPPPSSPPYAQARQEPSPSPSAIPYSLRVH